MAVVIAESPQKAHSKFPEGPQQTQIQHISGHVMVGLQTGASNAFGPDGRINEQREHQRPICYVGRPGRSSRAFGRAILLLAEQRH